MSRSLSAGRHALTGIAAAALCLTALPASALGLGRLVVQSALGESLRAEIDVTSLSAEEASNLRIRVAPPEQYRSAGVDYSPALQNTQAVLQRRADGRVYVRLTGDRAVREPFVDVILELTWNTGRLVRDYTLLLDPPQTRGAAAPAPLPSDTPLTTASPILSAAQGDTGSAGLLPRPRVEARRMATRTPLVDAAPAAVRTVRPVRERAVADAAPAAAGGGYRVRRGDTLSRIAARLQSPGVSMDQMLAALYRDNPQAFIGNSIDRLRFGAVLTVPSAAEASALGAGEARRAIRAQSSDFNAYRERLSGAAQATAPDGSPRRSGGKVQASVDERVRAAAPAADKLTLGKDGAVPAAATAPASAAADARARESRDNAARVAELRRNIEELQRLLAAASAPAAALPAPVRAPASAPTVIAPPVVVAAAPAPAPAPAAVVAAPPPVAVAPAPTVAPSVPALQPSVPVPRPASPSAVVAPSIPASRPVATGPAAVVETRSESSFLADNGPALGLGALAIALLAGFGLYRRRSRAHHDSGETSFLESRLQPDSFFGASGGQRIDTRDTGAPSSMSYSISQLDAIGDVDPVAEADVYLAYGRDLQAEEILKEAMRAHPERMAIRTKLLEVYAKRRDTKGYELLATQLYGLTYGTGDDWAKAQALGLQIDPDNPLYQPGGQPPAVDGGITLPHEPLGASTMPQSVQPQEFSATAPPSGFMPLPPSPGAAAAAARDIGVGLDLDLDLDVPAPPRIVSMAETTRPMGDFSATVPPQVTDFDLPFDTLPAAAPPARRSSSTPSFASAAYAAPALDFELPDIALDLDTPAPAVGTVITHAASAPSDGGTDFAAFDVSQTVGSGATDAAADDDEADPIERKLELAQEFREIGDSEGARELLLEVLAQAGGAQKMRAQSLLDHLG